MNIYIFSSGFVIMTSEHLIFNICLSYSAPTLYFLTFRFWSLHQSPRYISCSGIAISLGFHSVSPTNATILLYLIGEAFKSTVISCFLSSVLHLVTSFQSQPPTNFFLFYYSSWSLTILEFPLRHSISSFNLAENQKDFTFVMLNLY